MVTVHFKIWLIFGLALMAWSSAFGQAPAVVDSLPPMLLVMPVVNYSEEGEANTLLLPSLHRNLDRLGISYLTSSELRPLLREYRIRSRGWIGLEAAKILRRETGATYLLMASWDIFRADNNPEIGLSLRVLDLENLAVVGAVNEGLTGADFSGLLGLGRISSATELADLVMRQAFDSLWPLPHYKNPRLSSRGCFQVALIPFDNYSDTANAGEILTNLVLSSLLAEGYFVIEPGFIRELGLKLEVVNQGGLDQQSARSILADFGACRVLTGTVGEFNPGRGNPAQVVPSFSLGIRVMSPQDGNLYMMEELQGSGDDDEGVFQSGRIHALVPLANKIVQTFLSKLATNNREDILHGE